MTAETTAPPRPRRALRLMFDPIFGALFWGKMFAVVAVWTHGIVAAIVIYEATGSAVMVGTGRRRAVLPPAHPEPDQRQVGRHRRSGQSDPAGPGAVCRRFRVDGGLAGA